MKQFCDSATQEYVVFLLNPVNYSVAANEDIFELIKYDLIIQILENHADQLTLNKDDFSTIWVLEGFVKSKLDVYRITKSFLKAFVPAAENTIEFIDELKKISDEFFDYKKQVDKIDEANFKEYLDQFTRSAGSIYEQDEFTFLIKKYIAQIREANESKKKIVLLIDDLDRLDPDHLFRLFNIFSSHYNNDYTVNKFDFDKVIFVCDVNNVHRIFQNRYGQDVEFSGYIDKFYSTQIFPFDNKKISSGNVE